MVFWNTFHYGNLDLRPGTLKTRFWHAPPKLYYKGFVKNHWAAWKSCYPFSRNLVTFGDFLKYVSRAQNNNENVFFDPNLPCDCGLHFFIGPKLFSEKFIFCSKNAFFSCFQGFTKALKKSSPSFILQKWTALTFWWIKNFLDLQKYFRDNPVILLTMENISSNHKKSR